MYLIPELYKKSRTITLAIIKATAFSLDHPGSKDSARARAL